MPLEFAAATRSEPFHNSYCAAFTVPPFTVAPVTVLPDVSAPFILTAPLSASTVNVALPDLSRATKPASLMVSLPFEVRNSPPFNTLP